MASKQIELDLKKLKQIEQFEKDIVFGYIKKIVANKNNKIPQLITFIILAFYYEFEIFDNNLSSKELTLSDLKNNIITKKNGTKIGWESCAFGKQFIESNTNEKLIWTVKNIKGK